MNYEQVTDFSIVCCEIRSKSEVTKLASQIRTVNTTHNWLRSVTHTRKLKFHVWLKVELILEGITDIPQRAESGTGFYIDSKSLVTLIAKNTQTMWQFETSPKKWITHSPLSHRDLFTTKNKSGKTNCIKHWNWQFDSSPKRWIAQSSVKSYKDPFTRKNKFILYIVWEIQD